MDCYTLPFNKIFNFYKNGCIFTKIRKFFKKSASAAIKMWHYSHFLIITAYSAPKMCHSSPKVTTLYFLGERNLPLFLFNVDIVKVIPFIYYLRISRVSQTNCSFYQKLTFAQFTHIINTYNT